MDENSFPKKVRALESVYSLTRGKIYDVLDFSMDGESDPRYGKYTLDGLAGRFFAYRFEPCLEEDEKTSSNSSMISAKQCQSSIDIEEQRLRDILTRPPKGCCRCGIAKASCNYHA